MPIILLNKLFYNLLFLKQIFFLPLATFICFNGILLTTFAITWTLRLQDLISSNYTTRGVRHVSFWDAFDVFEVFKTFEFIKLLKSSIMFSSSMAGTFYSWGARAFYYWILLICQLTTNFYLAFWFCLIVSNLLIIYMVETDKEAEAYRTVGFLLEIAIGSKKMFLKVSICPFSIVSLLILLIWIFCWVFGQVLFSLTWFFIYLF